MLNKLFRPNLIIGTLPVTLANGTTADATQVMSDLNYVVNQVNANAAPLASPTFTGTQTLSAIAGAAVATQADQETGTSITTIVTPGRQQYHPSAAKAWIEITYSGGTPTNAASYNVTSIADTGTGVAGVTFTTAFSSTSYAAFSMSIAGSTQTSHYATATITSAGEIALRNYENAVATDPSSINGLAFGDQA